MNPRVRFSFCHFRFLPELSVLAVAVFTALFITFALPFQPAALAQTTSATLTGTVYDASGAIVADANVTLKNEASGDVRTTVSNAEGYFVFAAVPPATYSVFVERDGFATWEAKGIVLTADDKRNVGGIKLKPGAKTETVVVEASDTQITPTDSGEKSTLINQHILQNVAIVGQNAAEFIKIMPGMAFTGGVVNQSSYAAQDERTGTGPVGNFSANGGRTAALDITSDGAHIIDPGCNCGQAMNTNADMTAELKVMTSNFGADESKGPVVISAIGKSGGQQFHGEAYVYARNWHLNANDPQNKDAHFARPETKYFYPGGQIGGPLIIPGTSFNHNRDKVFFFFATEYYKQNVDNGVYHAVVPTAAMRQGNFSDAAYLKSLNGYAVTGVPNGGGLNTGPAASNPRGSAQGPLYKNGVLDPTQVCAGTWVYTDPKTGNKTTYPLCPVDPVSYANGQILANVYPLPNEDPTQLQGFNYANGETRYSNMLQFRGRVDYNISDSLKLYVSYNHQTDNALNSLDVLWGPGGTNTWAAPTTPYPTPIVEKSQSDVITANLTKVISPTLTNELIFSYTYLNLPNSFSDPSKVERGSLGLNYGLLFSHPNPDKLIFPEMTGWGSGISNMLNTGFELNGTVYAKKTLPSVADNLVKVWKTHTTKFGFYWERTWNEQPGNGSVNGSMIFTSWGGGSSGNAYADMLVGQTAQYSEQNFDVVPAFRYISAEGYATDSWKISRRFTLDYGLRISHLGPWVDTTGFGFAAWYPNAYNIAQGGSVNGATFPGIEWNKVNPSTPLSGSKSRLFFYNPRVGFAWDLFGTGRTVLRGGYGMYHFHDEQNVQNGAYGVVQGSFSSPTLNNPLLGQLGPSLATLNAPSGLTALDPNDSQEPRTQSYSFTVAERTPWKSLLEVAYVGSKSDYLSNYNNNFDQINDVGVSAMFTAQTCGSTSNSTGTLQCGWLPNCDPTVTNGSGSSCDHPDSSHSSGYSSGQIQNARPLQSGLCVTNNNCLGTLKIIDHKMYSNYNALQVTWNKQAGAFTFLSNYTFGKALGIRGEDGAATGDPLDLRSNYGTLPNNRTHIFNVAYVYALPIVHNANRFVKGAANGWQLSGITQYQSGADLQAAVTSNFGYSAYIPVGTTFMGKTLAVPIQASDSNIFGSPDITLMPALTCDPRKGLGPNQFVNGACFSPFVTPGKQGNYIFPTLTGPGFWNSDLSAQKGFTFGPSENRKLELRFSAYNFLNHPNLTFVSGDPALNLTFNSAGVRQNNGGTVFGTATNTIGHRIIQGMIRFSF